MRHALSLVFLAIALLTAGLSAAAAQDGAQYYYLDAANAQVGPFDLDGIGEGIRSDTIAKGTLMWTAGMAGWEPAESIAAVAPLFLPQPDPPPPDTAYYLTDETGLNLGPFTIADIEGKVRGGEVKPWSMVWISTTQKWDRADGYDELVSDLFPATPPAATAATIKLPMISPNLTPEERKKVGIALGATIGVLFHEMGHAIIGEMQVPVTGPEEDSVDEFAAIMMSTAFHPDAIREESPEIQALLLSMVQNSAMLWRRSEEDKARTGVTHPWYDSHSDDNNRFRNMLCIIYGSSPTTYAALADHVEFPKTQRDRCEFDYTRRQNAWKTIMGPFVRDLDGSGEGKAPADAPGGELVLEFRPSLTATGTHLAPVFRDSGIFQGIVDVMEKFFVWPKELKVTFADCGEFNAFYHELYSEVTMCWEGIEGFAGLVLDGEGVPRG